MKFKNIIKFKSIVRFHLVLIGASGVFLCFVFFNTASAITITPPRLELNNDPGKTITSQFKVTNDSDSTITYFTQVENFEAKDESGSPSFVPAKEGLATWVKVASSVQIKAGEQVTIPFTISIPRSAEPGGYFASIFVRTTPPSSSGGEVSIGARLGTLLLLRVNGEIREGVDVLEFATKDKQRVYSSLPVELYYRFQNTGADRVKPEGEIAVKNIFGLSAKILSANKQEGSVLPRSIRRFDSAWITGWGGKEEVTQTLPELTNGGFFAQAKSQLTNFAFGFYTANLDVRYGENNNVATGKFRFMVIPWQLLTLTLVIILSIYLILKYVLRSYTRRIIRKHIKK